MCIQVALDVGAVDDVQDGVGLLLHKVSTGDHLFQRVGGQRVDAGQILNDNVLVALQLASFFPRSRRASCPRTGWSRSGC